MKLSFRQVQAATRVLEILAGYADLETDRLCVPVRCGRAERTKAQAGSLLKVGQEVNVSQTHEALRALVLRMFDEGDVQARAD